MVSQESKKGLTIVLSASLFGANLYFLRTILGPFVVALAFGYVLYPLHWNKQHKKHLSSLCLTGTLFSLMGLFLAHLVPALRALIEALEQQSATHATQLHEHLVGIFAHMGWSHYAPGMMLLKEALHGGIQMVNGFFRQTLSDISTFEVAIFYAFTTPLATFYAVRDWPHISKWFVDKMEDLLNERLDILWHALRRTMPKALGGMMAWSLLLGLYYSLAFTLIGIDLGWLWGGTLGILSLVPYFGFLCGFILSLGIFFLAEAPFLSFALLMLSFLVPQILKQVYFYRWLPSANQVHPLWVFFSVFVAYLLMGPTGCFLTLPVAAFASSIFKWILSEADSHHTTPPTKLSAKRTMHKKAS